jgi:hypothetical protein
MICCVAAPAFGVDVHADDPGALAREQYRHRLAVAPARPHRAAAGDDGHLVLQASAHDQVSPGCCPVAPQLGLQHLAVVVLRQRCDKNVVLRPLEAGDRCAAQAIEFPARSVTSRRNAGPADDEGDHFLAPLGVGRPTTDTSATAVAQQDFLDLARINVGTAADDDVLGAVLQRQKAVGIEAADIAGVQPAITQASAVASGLRQ